MSHPITSPSVSGMLLHLGRCVLCLSLVLPGAGCSLLPKVDMEDGMDWGENYWDLREGMSQGEVVRRKGRPQQVRLVTEVERDARWWERLACRGCDRCRQGLPCTRWRTAEVWLYRDYMWNPSREGAWRFFDMDRWGSWDLYFDAEKKLRAVHMAEPAPSEPTARGVTWLRVEKQERYTKNFPRPLLIPDNQVNEVLSQLSPGRIKVLRQVTRACEPDDVIEIINTTQGVRPLRAGEKTYFKIKGDLHMAQGEWKWGTRTGTDEELMVKANTTEYARRVAVNPNVKYTSVEYLQFRGAEYIFAERSKRDAKQSQIIWTWIEVVD